MNGFEALCSICNVLGQWASFSMMSRPRRVIRVGGDFDRTDDIIGTLLATGRSSRKVEAVVAVLAGSPSHTT
jgi:hypothetical protein